MATYLLATDADWIVEQVQAALGTSQTTWILCRNGRAVRAAYTYGSPRVGDVTFYETYMPVLYRVVNNDDIVPHVPLRWMLVGLRLSNDLMQTTLVSGLKPRSRTGCARMKV